MRPELEVLCRCAASRRDDALARRFAELTAQPLDWTFLLEAARRHGLMPRLSHNLTASRPPAVPSPVLDLVEEEFRASTRRNLFLAAELLAILDACAARNIAVVPFKGAALAAATHGDPALRAPGDLDLLVRKREVERIAGLLAERGYRSAATLTDAASALVLRSRSARTFVSDPGRIFVDLHWNPLRVPLMSPRAVAGLWRRLETVRLAGRTIRTLSRCDALLIACAHGAKHRWSRLDWICDVAELAGTLDATAWEQVLRQARSLGFGRMLALGLILARELVGGVELPRMRLAADREAHRLAAVVRAALEAPPADRPDVAGDHAFLLRTMDRPRDRWRYGLNLVLNPTERDAVRMPFGIGGSLLLRLMRPARVLASHGPRLIRMLARGGERTR